MAVSQELQGVYQIIGTTKFNFSFTDMCFDPVSSECVDGAGLAFNCRRERCGDSSGDQRQVRGLTQLDLVL